MSSKPLKPQILVSFWRTWRGESYHSTIRPDHFYFLAHTAIGSQAARKPVRSFIFKLDTGGLVVRWVTTGESPLSYVFGRILELEFWQISQESRG
ncbi:hypothetical protein COCC4DRAFT_135620 [Bipolaris maydis ATCC 48331]|uniref:Uncharacterized protein n=2 Tax=Cochliobolus heterostrophus TaxID=5016 RepID=M2TJ28_COCH5|nr:hypothetical protein COCHEDRAFT_1116397 [Bipolaris maydis C5]ENI06457.1 hypothetical protein COCC4DRAFT_135620 [Bipolaris maydis ATCC 48331]